MDDLKDRYETGTTDEDISSAKKKYAETMKLMNKPSENKAKGIQLKLGAVSKEKPTDLNPKVMKKGGKVKCMAKGGGIEVRGKTKGRFC
jgi:hypothetical protein